MSDDVKLLGCPFCGEPGGISTVLPGGKKLYGCFWCGIYAHSPEDWNRRVPAPLAWSSERPKVAGLYYWRRPTDCGWKQNEMPIRVTEACIREDCFLTEYGHQYAFIPEPQEQP